MEKKYANQVRNYVYEPYDKKLDGVLTEMKVLEELEESFTLCEDHNGYKFLIKNYGSSSQRVFVVCDILND
jgi:hypothetical protein